MILLVEDDDTTRQTTAAILRYGGFEVVEAANGLEAWAALENRHATLILCDLQMPALDGWAFRQLLLRTSRLRAIPFVILSGLATADDEGRTLEAAMVLHKPVDEAELLACVQRLGSAAFLR